MKITIEADEIMVLTKGSDAGKYLIKGTLVKDESPSVQLSEKETCKWKIVNGMFCDQALKSPHESEIYLPLVIRSKAIIDVMYYCPTCGKKIGVVE